MADGVGSYPDIATIKALLLRESYISDTDSAAAEKASTDSNGYIEYLLKAELLSRTLLGQALAEHYGLHYVDLSQRPLRKEDIKKIPEDIARANRVALAHDDKRFAGLVTDTPDRVNLEQLDEVFAPRPIKLAYVLPEQLSAALDMYEQALGTRFSNIILGGERVAPELVEAIVKDAIRLQASDIHFEPRSDTVAVRFRIDGTLQTTGMLPRENYDNVLNRIKVESGMRIDEHLSSQDGAMQRQGDGYRADLRVSLVPTVQGEKIVMRVLSSYVQGFGLGDIGLGSHHHEQLQSYAAKPFGMILTVGPTGSGKSTTLYSVLKLLNRPDINITTIEDPVEYKIEGINQIQVRESSNMNFARGLRAIVRQDPDVILVGEIRDRETAEISVNAALTGHLLLSSFHANDAATAVPRLLDLDIEPFLLASTLQAIIAQRLVRKICDRCRHSQAVKDVHPEQKVHKDILSKHFKASDNIYIGKGCDACNDSGYRGRIALFEIIEMTPELQELCLKQPSSREVETLARKQGSISMFEDGISKVKTGLTTIEEVLRVVGAPRAARK